MEDGRALVNSNITFERVIQKGDKYQIVRKGYKISAVKLSESLTLKAFCNDFDEMCENYYNKGTEWLTLDELNAKEGIK